MLLTSGFNEFTPWQNTDNTVSFEPLRTTVNCKEKAIDFDVGDFAVVSLSWSTWFIADGRHLHVQGFCDGLSDQNKSLVYKDRLREVSSSWSNVYLLSENGCCTVTTSFDFTTPGTELTDEQKRGVKLSCISGGECLVLAVTEENIAGEVIEVDVRSFIFKPLPLKILIRSVSCGKDHALFLSKIGVVLSYGHGSRGQLGHGDTSNQSEAKVIEALEGVSMTSVSAGGWHSMALSDIGDVYAWGWNLSGQVGLPSQSVHEAKRLANHNNLQTVTETRDEKHSGFVQIQAEPCLVDITSEGPSCQQPLEFCAISCGSRHSAAVTENGQLYMWGWNAYGQLGTGTFLDEDKPVRIDSLLHKKLSVTAVTCGYWNTVITTTTQHGSTGSLV